MAKSNLKYQSHIDGYKCQHMQTAVCWGEPLWAGENPLDNQTQDAQRHCQDNVRRKQKPGYDKRLTKRAMQQTEQEAPCHRNG